jgi:hypothetical protein
VLISVLHKICVLAQQIVSGFVFSGGRFITEDSVYYFITEDNNYFIQE